ncbi:MAG: hypothetical protein AAGA81_07550 [Acidobacteriota bacterium]
MSVGGLGWWPSSQDLELALAVVALFAGGRAGLVSAAKERLRVERRASALSMLEDGRPGGERPFVPNLSRFEGEPDPEGRLDFARELGAASVAAHAQQELLTATVQPLRWYEREIAAQFRDSLGELDQGLAAISSACAAFVYQATRGEEAELFVQFDVVDIGMIDRQWMLAELGHLPSEDGAGQYLSASPIHYPAEQFRQLLQDMLRPSTIGQRWSVFVWRLRALRTAPGRWWSGREDRSERRRTVRRIHALAVEARAPLRSSGDEEIESPG